MMTPCTSWLDLYCVIAGTLERFGTVTSDRADAFKKNEFNLAANNLVPVSLALQIIMRCRRWRRLLR
jgi:hypothetical protein